MTDNSVIVDGVVLPTPAEDGIQLAPEYIWSTNAGRTANCEFVGDILAIKYTGTISWNTLTYAEMTIIRNAFTHLGKPYFWLTFTDDMGVRRKLRYYSTSPQSTIHTYRDKQGNITGVTVDIVGK